MGNKNCHARSKQKTKKLKEKNRLHRIVVNSAKKVVDLGGEKELPMGILGMLKGYRLRQAFDGYNARKRSQPGVLNQRQKRKTIRQMNGYKKAC